MKLPGRINGHGEAFHDPSIDVEPPNPELRTKLKRVRTPESLHRDTTACNQAKIARRTLGLLELPVSIIKHIRAGTNFIKSAPRWLLRFNCVCSTPTLNNGSSFLNVGTIMTTTQPIKSSELVKSGSRCSYQCTCSSTVRAWCRHRFSWR